MRIRDRPLTLYWDETSEVVQLDDLVERLEEIAIVHRKRPTVVMLEHPNQCALGFGVGGEISHLLWIDASGDPPYFVSRGQYSGDTRCLVWDDNREVGIDFPSDRWIDWPVAAAAVAEFAETGELPSCLDWQEV